MGIVRVPYLKILIEQCNELLKECEACDDEVLRQGLIKTYNSVRKRYVVTLRRLESEIEKMSLNEQIVVRASYISGMSLSRIAKMVNRSERTVSRILTGARQKIEDPRVRKYLMEAAEEARNKCNYEGSEK